MKVLVTGASGFIGRNLSSFIAGKGHEVVGTYLSTHELASRIPAHAGIRWVPLDLRDGAAVHELVSSVRPDAVFHLAAQAYAQVAWQDPVGTFETNVLGTIRLYEALRKAPPRDGVLLAASASAYGTPPAVPITEEMPLRAINPYGVSKASQEMLSFQYFRNYGLRIVPARLFITTGAGKTGDVINDVAQRVVALERSPDPGPLRVGNLDSRRDISDVRDIVRALWLLFERGDPSQPVNVGAGQSHSVRSIVETLVGLARRPLRVEVDSSLLRPTDEPELRADVRRLRALGFEPQHPIEETIADSLNFWRGAPT